MKPEVKPLRTEVLAPESARGRFDREFFSPCFEKLGFAMQYFPKLVHDEIEIRGWDVVIVNFLVKGEAVHHFDDRVVRDVPGTITITHYNQFHAIQTNAEGVELYNFYIDLKHHPMPEMPDALRPILGKVLPLDPNLSNDVNKRVQLHTADLDSILTIVRNCYLELQSQSVGYECAAMDYFRLFWIECCRLAQEELKLKENRDESHDIPRKLLEARRYIDQHFSESHKIPELAARFGYTPNYLSTIFKAYTGKTVNEYIIQKRIQKALIELKASDRKILSIAHDCGFNDLANFNRTFKKLLGKTPSGYRSERTQPWKQRK